LAQKNGNGVNLMKQIIILHDKRHAIVTFDQSLGRVDLIVNGESLDGTNIANDDFPSGEKLESRLEGWGKEQLKNFHDCDVCHKRDTYAPPLHDYDIKEFPDLAGKTVCRSCRSNRYNEIIGDALRQEKASWLSCFPNKGPIKVTNINLCTIPTCSCGWNITLHVSNDNALKQLQLTGLHIRKTKKDTVMIGGTSEQWPQLQKICKLVGGKMPPDYPPTPTV